MVARVLAGDIDAFEEIVRRHQGEVWKLVSLMLLNRDKTEDLVEQTFISAFHHLDRYDRARDFGVWIKEIARNEVRQEIRRYVREDHRLEVYQTHLLQSYDEPSASTQQERLEQALHQCTEKLPPSSAKLVELRYQSALNFTEIASIIGRTIEATRQQLARIRLTLRECMEKCLAEL